MLKRCYLLMLLLSVTVFFACETFMAGGSDEQTNAIAGLVLGPDQKPVSGVEVAARSISGNHSPEEIVALDTTASDGSFTLHFEKSGTYGVSAEKDSLLYYFVLDVTEQDTFRLNAVLRPQNTLSGTLYLREDSVAAFVEMRIPGSPWKTKTDASGNFEFEKVPEGQFEVFVISPDYQRFTSVSYWLSVSEKDALSSGPFENHENFIGNRDSLPASSPLLGYSSLSNWFLPLSSEYALVGWWAMDVFGAGAGNTKTISDSRSHTDPGLVYGDAFLEKSPQGKALVLKKASDFAVVENDRGVLDSATVFTVEAWVYVDSLGSVVDYYRKNIVGKLGFGSEIDGDIFTLAVIGNTCGIKQEGVFAFFLADGTGMDFTCQNAAVDSRPLKTKEWIYLVGTWDGSELRLYRNGVLAAKTSTAIRVLAPSSEPLFFGKEDLSLKIDNVRWSRVALDSTDVIFRYRQGGSL
ncbi:MAG: hypothetical protein LBR60_00990 [Fibrobacter sp.]|jgi:hypothetical protein|nr:hypothetical protein [Fibrobacter sp.]